MPTIDAKRLMSDLRTLRSFGAVENGVVRPSLSEADMAARRWLAERMAEAGLVSRIDGVGNVVGRSRLPGPALLVGSHSDTQPRGGWLDGALGVVYGLELARAFAQDPDTRDLAVDAVSWIDEEGTYLGCLGSKAFCGVLEEADADAARNASGQALRDALAAARLGGTSVARLEPDRHLAYLEAHIEQGPHLETAGNQIGVVTSIVGIRGARVRFEGQQNHAGTTPMALRKDAGVALVDYAHALHRELAALAGPRTVWTVGRVSFAPGASSIIPGRAELMLQMRDPEDGNLDALEAKARALAEAASAAGPVAVHYARNRRPVRPTFMDERLQDCIAEAAEQHVPGRSVRMPSGAGHDAMVVCNHLPSAMLFIPSIGGISHDFAEDSHEADIVAGCQVLATAAEKAHRRLGR